MATSLTPHQASSPTASSLSEVLASSVQQSSSSTPQFGRQQQARNNLVAEFNACTPPLSNRCGPFTQVEGDTGSLSSGASTFSDESNPTNAVNTCDSTTFNLIIRERLQSLSSLVKDVITHLLLPGNSILSADKVEQRIMLDERFRDFIISTAFTVRLLSPHSADEPGTPAMSTPHGRGSGLPSTSYSPPQSVQRGMKVITDIRKNKQVSADKNFPAIYNVSVSLKF